MDYEESLRKLDLAQRAEFALQSLASMSNSYPPPVIHGLLRQMEILLMGGQAKRWKSWARMDMLYCVANGFKWLGFQCVQGPVLHFDLELLEADIRHRFELIHQSYRDQGLTGSFDNMRFVCLRGKPFTTADLEALPEKLTELHFILLSLDPVYRLLAGQSESDQAAVSQLLNHFLTLGANLHSAIALLQHFAKGDPSHKDAQDRFSGSGVWARYPDALMTFTDLQDENCFSCEFGVRSFQPIEPFGVRWQFPRFHVDPTLNPDNLKTSPGRPKTTSIDDFCSIISTNETISYSDLWRRAQKTLHISQATFDRRLKEARSANAIYLSKTENGYGLTPQYISKNGH